MTYLIVQSGISRSFPPGDPFLDGASASGDVHVYLGAAYRPDPAAAAVLIELGSECLGEHTGESAALEGSNVLGFSRYRNGADSPSNLVELVKQPATVATAIGAARALFEAAGLQVALCADQDGRIIDRLVRPKYNAALRFLDEGLASAADMDLTCRLGLGYPDGPIERLERGGLAHHFAVSQALFEAYGTAAYTPARRARVAHRRDRG